MKIDYDLTTIEGQFNLGRTLGFKCGKDCLYSQIDRYGSPGHRTLTTEQMTQLSYKINIMTLLEKEGVEVGDEIYLSSALDDGF